MANKNDGSNFGAAIAVVALLAFAALAGFGVYTGMGQLFEDDEVATWVKVATSVGVGALIVAALTAFGHRLREARTENLKDVEL